MSDVKVVETGKIKEFEELQVVNKVDVVNA